MRAYRERLIETRAAIPGLIKGCSEAEIATLEQQYGLRLPPVYRTFLATMGHEAGNMFVGSDVFYGYLPRLRAWAEELLQDQGVTAELPPAAFVFYMHQGYEFMYFLTTEGDDPPVYHFGEGKPAPARIYDSFSAYLEDALEHYIHRYDDLD